MNAADITLYTRMGCHLCDDAKGALKALALTWTEVDIDADDDLRSLYGERVPVIAVKGHVVAEGNLNEKPLAQLLRG